jgi:hypothetical protein
MVESDDFDLTYFINSQLKFINQAIKGLFDYVDKKQNDSTLIFYIFTLQNDKGLKVR